MCRNFWLTTVIFLRCTVCNKAAKYPGAGRSKMMLAQPTNALLIQVISKKYPPTKTKDIVPPSQDDVQKDDR